MATLDLRRQFFSEDRHLFAFRRPDVCRKVPRKEIPFVAVFMSDWSKQKQFGHLACHQPWKAASLLRAPECQTPIAVDPVPAHIGDFKSFAGHGFHRVSEDRFYLSDLDSHRCRAKASQAGELGFEPSSLASTPHRRDTGLTLENLVSQAFTIQPAPVYIIATLG